MQPGTTTVQVSACKRALGAVPGVCGRTVHNNACTVQPVLLHAYTACGTEMVMCVPLGGIGASAWCFFNPQLLNLLRNQGLLLPAIRPTLRPFALSTFRNCGCPVLRHL
jgi:hypothetical protein